MKKINLSRKLEQLKVLSRRVQVLLKRKDQESREEIIKLKDKINSLLNVLRFSFSKLELKKILGTAVLILGLSFSNSLSAQWFDEPVQDPFGLVSIPYLGHPSFADLDDDGDYDMIIGGYIYDYGSYYDEYSKFQYFENTGSATNPQFTNPESNPFGLDFSSVFILPAFVDLDDDGDFDLMATEYYNNILYFENTGTSSEALFATSASNPFNLSLDSASIINALSFVDIDDDGDFDLFIGGSTIIGEYSYIGSVRFFENTGSASEPSFATPVDNPFGITIDGIFESPAFADLDNDGDMDLMMGETIENTYYGYSGVFQYFENTGTASNPEFATPITNTFGLDSTNTLALSTFVDLDNDGDVDLMVGEYYGQLEYFENINSEPLGITEKYNNESISLFPNPVIDFLIVDTAEEIDRIEIIDVLGKTSIHSINISNQIDVSALNTGMYMIKVHFKNGNIGIKKIIKE